VTKRPNALCKMPNGAGGICVIATCGGNRPCLQCVHGPINSSSGSAYYLLIIVAVLVTIGGTVMVLRIRKYWK